MSPRRFAVVILLSSVIGCGLNEVALISTGPLEDLARIPQDATVFAEPGGPPILKAAEWRLGEFENYWYGPWKQTEPTICTVQEFSWAAESFPNRPVFGPNLLEVPASRIEAVMANARLDQYPSRAGYGITVRNTSMRALPSPDPFFYDFREAGEGYPFDYNQNSVVWAGTPLFLSHVSQDERFLAVESPFTCGWIDARDVAFVDDEFVAKYRSAKLAAVRRDRIRISSERTGFLFQGRIGMLLPIQTSSEDSLLLLAPVADEGRRASLAHARLSSRDAAPIPLPFSEEQIAQVINEILGQAYGWGGLGGYRDCSSTILDVFLPFAVPLPRNSRQQASAGINVPIEHLSPAEKREHILATAVPFRTILNLDGHNMLYLGEFEGSPVVFHTIWGLRTASADESSVGRYLIGKSVITGLSPGRELRDLSRNRGDLLSRIRSFTLLGEQKVSGPSWHE